MSKPPPKSDYEVCKGQDENGNNFCGFRVRCARYVNVQKSTKFKPFYEADDCPKYESLNHGN